MRYGPRRGKNSTRHRSSDSGVTMARAGLFPFFQVAFMHYHAEEQSMLIECAPGTIVVLGSKSWEFCEPFCSHKVSLLKADGKDILAVTMALRSAGTT